MNIELDRDFSREITALHGVACNRPCPGNTRVPTVTIANRFLAGERLASIAEDFEMPLKFAENAIAYELAVAKGLVAEIIPKPPPIT